ncbi:hypothetical protein [Kineosporia sp. A_224]|uniref:hypothetical protein n=1 Tax=Kineosporia sp. A_224 TaxID=1962180 RepID=UPI001179BF06|nr:hypothetical protein [Kineosporia sp. A_224]
MDSTVPAGAQGSEHEGPPPARDAQTVVDVARRAATLAEDLAHLLGKLAGAAAGDARVRQARYRLQDAADSCRRAGQELKVLVECPEVPPQRCP